MKDALLKFALRIILQFVSSYLTPDKVEEGKAKFVALMRELAKDKTPDFPFDDELVEIVAKALGVPA